MFKNDAVPIHPYILGCLLFNGIDTILSLGIDGKPETSSELAAVHALTHTPIHKINLGLAAFVEAEENPDIRYPWWNYDKHEFIPGWISKQLGVIL